MDESYPNDVVHSSYPSHPESITVSLYVLHDIDGHCTGSAAITI